jgi:hypothetical protein
VGDASTSYGIGILIGRRWAQFQLRDDWAAKENQELRIARLETIAVQLGLLMLEKLGIKKGKNFIVRTDNTTTEGAIWKRKSGDRQVNEEWKRIQHLLVKLEADLVAKRVTSKENKADSLSRGEREGHRPKDVVPILLPADLKDLLKQRGTSPL